jgi:hypothetical protein
LIDGQPDDALSNRFANTSANMPHRAVAEVLEGRVLCGPDDALAGLTPEAEPEKPQCQDCVESLAMQLPPVSVQEDPFYEEGLSAGSVLPSLARSTLDDDEIPVLQRIIAIFNDVWIESGGTPYVREHLERMPRVNADDRARLMDGAAQSLDSTLRHLMDHNCRILLKSHFDDGVGRRRNSDDRRINDR